MESCFRSELTLMPIFPNQLICQAAGSVAAMSQLTAGGNPWRSDSVRCDEKTNGVVLQADSHWGLIATFIRNNCYAFPVFDFLLFDIIGGYPKRTFLGRESGAQYLLL